jgi:hypothetical protein
MNNYQKEEGRKKKVFLFYWTTDGVARMVVLEW